MLINPEIEILAAEKEGGWEGCLSVPGLRGWVERPAHIRYRGLGLNGKPIERVANGFHARVVQHECDHLDGILYPQRMTDLTKLIFESETKHWLEQASEANPPRRQRKHGAKRSSPRRWPHVAFDGWPDKTLRTRPNAVGASRRRAQGRLPARRSRRDRSSSPTTPIAAPSTRSKRPT